MINAKPIKYTVILEPADEGGYVVSCPALPGCISQGETLEETMENVKQAILLVIEVLQEDGEQIPNETPEIVTDEIREILKARAEEGLPLIIETHEVYLPAAVTV